MKNNIPEEEEDIYTFVPVFSNGEFMHVDSKEKTQDLEYFKVSIKNLINERNGFFDIPDSLIQHLLSDDVKKWYNENLEVDFLPSESVKKIHSPSTAVSAQFAFKFEHNDLESKFKFLFDSFDLLTKKGYLGVGSMVKCTMMKTATTFFHQAYICFTFPLTTPKFQKAYKKAFMQLKKRKKDPYIHLNKSKFLNNIIKSKLFYEEGESMSSEIYKLDEIDMANRNLEVVFT